MKKEEVLKFYQNFRLYIFPAVIALSSIILIVLVIYPQIIKLLDNQKKAEDFSQKSKFMEAKAKELENYDPSDLDLKVKIALGSFPTDKDYLDIVNLLQNITAQSGFSIVSMALGSSAVKSSGIQSYGVKLEVLGPTVQLSSFISNIESSYRLMRVSNLETSTEKGSQVDVSLNVDVLYADAPTGFGSVDSPLPKLSQKDQDILSKLSSANVVFESSVSSQLGPRGKQDPFQ